uniref:uncharacterized protein LOC124031650 isoform X3 n=1 Tax=Oncorhynchus gorbuscha TaxID=8017 RepID=UPI001EAECA8D|nr:uncharacterized protein LOC124031650 isoform X3 [Oncorhynchus gorbuscha]XP_046199107.1 uncharacterized protein LOC124031650 isoform X3 [Oncorhynchus gorbuscha]XP_046199197.1 uncharacterized protein LOC124031681 isoform X3 [Oncorhynchus gorbuscha]
MKLPLSIPRSTPVRQSRYLMVTPLTLPIIISPASAALSVSQSVPRLDPLHPPLANRRTVSLETPAVHHHNHQRALVMQRKEHYRYHQVWRKPFYGSCTEREEYRFSRSEVRQQLKRQMEEKRAGLMLKLTSKAEEAEFLQEVDRLALSSEKQQRIQHSRAMSHYRDENKKLMEQSSRALIRSQEALMERELLRHNPINWSGTLK